MPSPAKPATPAVVAPEPADDSAAAYTRRERSVWLLPAGVLLIALALCATWWWSGVREREVQVEVDFRRLVRNAQAEIDRRVGVYLDAMQAGAGFLRASTRVERAEWREFTETIAIDQRYPGIRGLGVILPVAPDDLSAFVAAARRDGAPDFSIRAAGPEPFDGAHAIITFIEPQDRNRAALGLDIARDARRQAAAIASRDTGQPRLTARIELVQDQQHRPAALLFVPVYRSGTFPATVADRRANHIGWVYAPVLIEELFRGVLGPRIGRLEFTCYEGTDTTPGQRVFHYGPSSPTEARVASVTSLELGGRVFSLAWSRGPEFAVPSLRPLAERVAGGVVASFLLAGLIWSVQATGVRARQLARRLTSDMRRTQLDLEVATQLQRTVIDGTVHGIIGTDSDGVITLFNRGAERMLGYSQQEVVGRMTAHAFLVAGEVRSRAEELTHFLGRPVAPAFEAIVARAREGEVDEREWTYVRKDGSSLPVLLSVTSLRGEHGESTGFLCFAHDLTDRKKAEIAFRAGEERLGRVLGHADCLVWEAKVTLLPQDWNWRMAVFPSALYSRLLGRAAPAEGAGLWYQFSVPEQPEMNRRSREAMESGLPGYAQEFRLCRDGETIWLRESVAITRESPDQYWLVGVAIEITDRKRIEAALRESEQRRGDVFRSMSEGLILYGPDGKVVECNAAAVQILGTTQEHILGRSIFDLGWSLLDESGKLLPRDSAPTIITLRTGAPQREVVVGLRRLDGHLTWISVNTEPVHTGEGALRGVLASFVDITARKVAEQAVAQSEALLRTITSIIPGMVGYWTTDQRNAFANSEYVRWFGKTPEQMHGMTMRELLGPELYAQNEPFITAVLGGTPQRFLRDLVRRDGSLRHTWAQYIPDFEPDQKTVRGFVVLVSDITELKEKEDALRASESRLRLSLREVNDLKTAMDAHAIVAITDASGVITYANDRFCSISGYTRQELIGSTHRLMKSGRHSREFYREMWATITAGRIWHGEVANRKKDGAIYWVDATIVPFLGEDGRPVQYIAIRTDITGRKRLEENLAIARDQALEASRLKSEFLATISHEIRTPMNAIIGMAGLMVGSQLPPAESEMARVISTAAESLLTIINDLLDFSRIESGQMRLDVATFNLRQVIEQAVALLEPKAREKNLQLTQQCPTECDTPLLGDEGRVRQVLMNLVGNAVKFTDAGAVTVRVNLITESNAHVRVRLEVRDTGIGIPAEASNRLFQPFVQIDASATRRFGGTGLGLAITRQVVSAMGGEIGFESEFGKGSTFWVELGFPRAMPARAPEPGQVATEAAEVARAEHRQLRVLVVEDNAANQHVASLLLASLGHVAEIAADGVQALERLGRESFDVVLMDCQMPNLDGYETTRQIRSGTLPAVNARVPVVALTAYARAEDWRRCRDAGMDDYVAKPIRVAELKGALQRALSGTPAVPPDAAPIAADRDGILDPRVVEMTRGLPGMRGPSLLPELIEAYLSDDLSRLDRIHRLVAEHDASAAVELHAFGGNAAAFGAVEVRRMALELEEAVGAGRWTEAASRFEEFQSAAARLRVAANALRTSNP